MASLLFEEEKLCCVSRVPVCGRYLLRVTTAEGQSSMSLDAWLQHRENMKETFAMLPKEYWLTPKDWQQTVQNHMPAKEALVPSFKLSDLDFWATVKGVGDQHTFSASFVVTLISLYTHIYACSHAYISIHTYTHAHINVYAYAYQCVSTGVCVWVCIYTCTYTYTHTYTFFFQKNNLKTQCILGL